MSSYYVKTALVVATDSEGRHRYLYRDADVPADIPADEVKRLANEGFIGKLDDGEVKPRDKWKLEELKAYADQHSIDLGDATLKTDVLAAIEAAEKPE